MTTPVAFEPFWRWAFSDLRSNATRGVFAEYLVGCALGVDMSAGRVEWAPWDLMTPRGVRVEVKCGAYVQAWASPKKPSTVQYSGLLARSWVDGPVGSYSDHPDVRADVYVFALQTCREPHRYDALNSAQWEFRVVPGPVVRRWGQRTVSLGRLNSEGYAGLGATALTSAVDAAAAVK